MTFLIREKVSSNGNYLGSWWTNFQKDGNNIKKSLISELQEKGIEESFKKFGFSEELR